MEKFFPIDELCIMNMSSEERVKFLIELIRKHNRLIEKYDQLLYALFEIKLKEYLEGGNKQ